MNKNLLALVLAFVIVSVVFFSPVAVSVTGSTGFFNLEDSMEPATDYIPRNIRVAIYNELNFTAPAYATMPGGVNNNATGLMDILVGYGYDVTLLDVHDISNNELTTLNFDVFCLVDNFPRENITYRIMDFWLGGGGLLVFDGSAGFLCSFGILPPEAIGTSGFSTYWTYSSSIISFVGLHPVSRSMTLPYSVPTSSGALTWDFLALQATSIGSDLTKVATSNIDPNDATILAYDPSDRGGRVVTIAHDLDNMQVPELYPIYSDAVEWLTPKPKARVLFDLTHRPWCPTDPWEWSGDSNYLTTWRNGLVSRSYTLDKLKPSTTGNLTLENLANYDMLVTNQPMVNYTAAEVDAVEQWVSAGGGLFVIGDNPGVPDNYRLNDLINSYGIQFNHDVSPFDETFFDYNLHPANAEALNLAYHGAAALNITDNAVRLWNYTSGEIAAAASEYGTGRVVVIADANSVLDTWIVEGHNYVFSMSVANWLTSSKARVLLYHDNTGIPSYNHYRSGVANALNELGIRFMFTETPEYFNLSMKMQDWDLVISDANSRSSVTLYPLILDHLRMGGKLIMRDFFFRYRAEDFPQWDFSLFSYIGFVGSGPDERITSGAPTVYLWDEFHEIFDKPVEFTVSRFESTSNYYGTDWTNVTLFENATAIAGITPTPEENQSAIVLGADGRALCNMFSISQYLDDYDNSTYADNFEIWLNEIAYMMKPTIESPGDLTFEIGSVTEITWIPHSYGPFDYQIKRNSLIITTQLWDGSPISADISSLAVGVYEFQLTVRDRAGYRADDYITVTIEAASTTSSTTTTTPISPPPILDLTIMIFLAVGGFVIIVVIVVLLKKR
ncbi:MAG: hypothetical protein ACFFDM_05880 [Candidatus Thorarchaeota archaeon]